MRRSTSLPWATRPLTRPAWTMIDMVVVMYALGIAMLTGTALLVGTFQMNRAATDAVDRLSLQGALADQFRADVARATEAPDRVNELTAGPACLILRMASDQHVVYRWENDQLERSDNEGGPPMWQVVPIGPHCTGGEFDRTAPGVIALRLRQARGENLPGRPREIAAALGGDRR